MKLSDFDYHLPGELIAQYPLKERDSARLLVVDRKKESIEHRAFKDIIDYLDSDDVLVLNDTKVLPARLLGRRATGGKVEILLLRRKDGLTFEALLRPARLKPQETILFDDKRLQGMVTGKKEVTFSAKDLETIYSNGVVPLPPYIKRQVTAEDAKEYQTVYAKHEGAVASPTAGLHFTEGLLKAIQSKGAAMVYVTLHVGYATFKPVKAENIVEHIMDEEYFEISKIAEQEIHKAQATKKRIVAVGTTSCRALESYA
ncbi:MAG: tRNA preQ1(34) S-adenosylmethionine ribosyltransferase-isomerase QueA, partial [Candidatus Omnitrophica bacterium]|nr:tRNA preQ1(34) S-adenosylmethionine ribosyltransferase-isomerase QueA [Candidatus Omnitrophota bacterium]